MKTMRELKESNERMSDVDLSLDVWHKSKSIRKALGKVSSSKENARLKEWITPIVNHFWYCSRTCGGKADVLKVSIYEPTTSLTPFLPVLCRQKLWKIMENSDLGRLFD